MLSSPGTPRRPQSASERLASVRTNLLALRGSVEASETYAFAHLAAPTARPLSSNVQSHSAPASPPPTMGPPAAPVQAVAATAAAATSAAVAPDPNGTKEAWTPSGRRKSVADAKKSAGARQNSATAVMNASSLASTVAPPTVTEQQPQQRALSVSGTWQNSSSDAQFGSSHHRDQASPPPHLTLSANNIATFEDALVVMKQHAIKIEEHLAMEATVRQDGDRRLKLLVEQRVKEALQALERKTVDRLAEMRAQVDSLTKKLDKVQCELAQEREKNVRLTQELKYQATQGVSEVQEHVVQVRNLCQTSQGLLTKTLTENVFRIHERLDAERHSRESMLRNVREEIAAAAKQRDKFDDRLLHQLRDDMVSMDVRLRQEKETRERAEEQLAAAMEDVVSQIQLGLRNVAR